MRFVDGSIYVGNFKNDKPHGKGKMTTNDGVSEVGMWDNGKFMDG